MVNLYRSVSRRERMITGAMHWAERSEGQFSRVACRRSSARGDVWRMLSARKLQWHMFLRYVYF